MAIISFAKPARRLTKTAALHVYGLLLSLCLSLPAWGDQLQVDIEGLSGELLDNVRAMLGIERNKSRDLSFAQIRRYHQRARDEIERALQPFGYYAPSIDAHLERRDSGWLARYRIAPGIPVVVRSLVLHLDGPGEEDTALKRAVADFPLAVGDVFRSDRYENGKKGLLRRANDGGYLDAQFPSSRVTVDPQAASADIRIELATGRLYRLGRVEFSGSVPLDDAFLRRFVRFQPGDPWSAPALTELQRALIDSGYFASAEVMPQIARTEGEDVPVQVRLRPRKRQKYTLGAGFATDTGPRGRLGWEFRPLNRRGHYLVSRISASPLRQDASASYVIPIRDVRRDRFDISAALENEETDDTRRISRRFGVARNLNHERWRETASLSFLNERFDAGGTSGRTTNFLLWGGGWTYALSDGRRPVRRGFLLGIDLKAAADRLFSDVNLLRGELRSKIILPLGKRGRVLLRGNLGTSVTGAFDQVPVSLRFFAGGDQSVRGYSFMSLGPRDDSDDVVGGQHLLVGSAEYEHVVTGPWRAAVFYDVGNALDDFHGRLARGAGVGLHWASPIGLLRLDVAKALSKDSEPFRIHLSLEPDF